MDLNAKENNFFYFFFNFETNQIKSNFFNISMFFQVLLTQIIQIHNVKSFKCNKTEFRNRTDRKK